MEEIEAFCDVFLICPNSAHSSLQKQAIFLYTSQHDSILL